MEHHAWVDFFLNFNGHYDQKAKSEKVPHILATVLLTTATPKYLGLLGQ